MYEPHPLSPRMIASLLDHPANDNGGTLLDDSIWQSVDARPSEHPGLGREMGLVDSEVLRQKLVDMNTPGFMAEFDPDEADALGAFVEDALSEEDALDATCDLLDLVDVPGVTDVTDVTDGQASA